MDPDETKDHELLNAFLAVRETCLEQNRQVLELYRQKRFEDASNLSAGSMTTCWLEGRKYLNALTDLNKDIADRAVVNIVARVEDARTGMLMSVVLAVLAAVVCGLLLMRVITRSI